MSAIDELHAKVINMSFTELMDDYIKDIVSEANSHDFASAYNREYIKMIRDELNNRMDKDRG